MARSFASASSQFLSTDSFSISGFPVTLCCWFRPADVTSNSALLGFNSSAQNVNSTCLIYALGAVAGDPVAAYTAENVAEQRVDSTSGFSANTWHHVCGVFSSATSRTIYLNGGSSATGTTSITPAFAQASRLTLGSWYSDVSNAYILHANGRIAEAAVYGAALTLAEVTALVKGYTPPQIRPQSLTAYWPLGGHYGQNDLDRWKNKLDLAPTNSPTWADHDRIIYPPTQNVGEVSVAAGGATPWLYARRPSRIIGGGVS